MTADDIIRQCAVEIVDHVNWKAPEQLAACAAESLWEMTQALALDPGPLRESMQQVTRELLASETTWVGDVDRVEARLRQALGPPFEHPLELAVAPETEKGSGFYVDPAGRVRNCRTDALVDHPPEAEICAWQRVIENAWAALLPHCGEYADVDRAVGWLNALRDRIAPWGLPIPLDPETP